MGKAILAILLLAAFGKAFSYFFEKMEKIQGTDTCQPNPTQLEQENLQNHQNYFAAVISPLMKANSQALKLEEPNSYAQHDPGPGNRIRQINGKPVFCYVFRRASLVSGGVQNTQIRFSTLPAKKIAGYLIPLLNQYAIAAGFPLGRLVVKDMSSGRVALYVMFQ